MNDTRTPSERHYLFHLRRMGLGLAFSFATGLAMVIALMQPGLRFSYLLAPALVFILATLVLNLALRGRAWTRPDSEELRINRDERVRANADHSRRTALKAIYLAQVPLIPLVAYLQADPPSVEATAVAMALLTMSVGSTAFFTAYLWRSRLDAHG